MVLLHGNSTGWTPFNAQAALDAPGFVFEYDSGQIEPLRFFVGYAGEGFYQL